MVMILFVETLNWSVMDMAFQNYLDHHYERGNELS